MKIIELFIDPNFEEGGIDFISLVDRPAIESNFLTFSEEQVDEIEPVYLGEIFCEEEQIEMARVINSLGEPVGTLEKEGFKIVGFKPVRTLKEEIEKEAFYDIISTPNDVSGEDGGEYRVRYKYQVAPGMGKPIIDTSRTFCKDMLRYNRVFRIEDIIAMTNDCTNEEFGCYDILTFRGSYNCRHLWYKVLYRKQGAITGAIRPVQPPSQPSWAQPSTQVFKSTTEVKNEFGILSIIDGQPLFENVEDALKLAEIIGCEGYHEHQVGDTIGYMACSSHEFKSFDDYPKAARENACRARKYKEENPTIDCGTNVGWVRSAQLCNGEPISEDTIARMSGFRRHQQNKDVPYDEGCGGIMWDAWGGDEGIDWAERKLEQLRNSLASERVSFDFDDTLNTEKGKELARQKLDEGFEVFVISARDDKEGMLEVTRDLGIKDENVYATGDNERKVELVKELDTIHYDNNRDVIDALGARGIAFDIIVITPPYTDETTTGVTSENIFNYSFSYDEEKMEITGAAMIPNKMIVRRNPITEEIYYVFFSKNTIKELADRFMRNNSNDRANLNHTETLAKDTHIIESWLVNDSKKDKSYSLGLEYPEGTWVVTMSVKDTNLWNDIKNGKYQGYSIEGYFNERMVFN